MGRVRRVLRKPVVIGVLVAGALAVAAGLVWFQPWKLWVDETVRESVPSAAGSARAGGGTGGVRTLATGDLISHEHSTSGKVRILQLPDGSRTLRIENLDTSNGPDVKVLLSDAPVKKGRDGWYVFDDGAHRSLGSLKGNKGDQNYALPADVDLSRYTSVSIWCDRFDVSFGATALKPV
ncbi:electron transporter [Streptomyces sp. NRRL B-1677]|uniref:Electron transporter n=1 Tax=Streptomyces klenkii TaxID=1420899 RepID=A0A3B0BFF9_9ACTN|nr:MULTISPECIES: DM13 domain-containing protein [Streptomyces]MBF6047478.1 electron transporter [Streptomyces sp. NRRL B-1677]RKN71520.1 electron transporter [Streptomyces klenkii]